METAIGVLTPFFGTLLGASMVLFMKKGLGTGMRKMMNGFASGVMLAASVWSLLLPAIEKSEASGGIAWLPAATGFVVGILFLMFLDAVLPQLREDLPATTDACSAAKKNKMLFLAVTIHNIPEGMAVGAVFAALLVGEVGIFFSGAMALSIGIAIQNIPEGAIISLPLRNDGHSRGNAFLYGLFSGVVEPIAAVVTIVLAGIMVPVLPFLLAFAAGAMVYVVAEELIPAFREGGSSRIGILGLSAGFVVMMILDVALG